MGKQVWGEIGLAVSNDGVHWQYKQIVLDEPFHLSYPYIFKWSDRYYMIPESGDVCEVRLYETIEFPLKWRYVKTLLYGCYRDPSIFYYKSVWWMYLYEEEGVLRLFFAYDLTGQWKEHPMSPIVRCNNSIARPGGRVLVLGDRIIRFAQDDHLTYGRQVLAFEVLKLSLTEYEEKPFSQEVILKPAGSGWNADGMHHMDAHYLGNGTWIACVDGYRNELVFGIQY